MTRKKTIDDVQAATVEEHFQTLVKDNKLLDANAGDITFDDLPDWYNEELFKKGQLYYQRNLLSMGVSALVGLIAILSVPETLKVLIFTKQSGTVCSAFRRYAQTLLHTHALYVADPNDPGSRWYKSINVIRKKHEISSRKCTNSGFEGIYERDMAITQFGFIGFALLSPKPFALTNEKEGREGLNHIWRVLGHLLGISDSINICRKTEAETTELCQRIKTEILAKYMREAPADYKEMTRIMLEGMWFLDMSTNVDTSLFFTYKLVDLEYKEPLNWVSLLNLWYHDFMTFLLRLPVLGPILRTYYYYHVSVSYWLLEHFPIAAWIKFGKLQSRFELYPQVKYSAD